MASGLEAQDLLNVGVEGVSRRLYRGYDRGDGWAIAPSFGVGLLGYATTSDGRWGLFLDGSGGVLLEDRSGHPRADDLVLTLSAARRLGSGDDQVLRLAYRQSFFANSGVEEAHSEEVHLRYEGTLAWEKPGIVLRPFVEVAHDFNRYDGTLTAFGFAHALSLEKRFHVRASLDLSGDVAWSNWRGAPLPSKATAVPVARSFGFHHGGVGVAVPFERELRSGAVLVLGPEVHWDWAGSGIRTSGGFSWGARLSVER